MLQFQELTAAHGDRLRGYYRNCDYRLCEYSLGVKLMWRDHLHPSFAEVAGLPCDPQLYRGRVRL